MAESTDWLPLQVESLPSLGPRVEIAFDAALAYMGNYGVDVSAIIGGVQAALAAVVNATGDGDTLHVADLRAAAEAVAGVAAVRSLTLDGATSDAAAAQFFSEPQYIGATDVRIVPA
jgi:hypothetical protein